jgi:hypothetical protein
MKITILQRPGQFTTRDFQPELGNALRSLKGELGASFRIDGFSPKGWAKLDLNGDDSDIFKELIARNLAQAQTDATGLELQSNYEGIVCSQTEDHLGVDIGIETPKPMTIKIGLGALRAQLGDGRALRASEIIRDYCLVPGSRTTIRLTRLEPNLQVGEGWLADTEIERLSSRITTGLDRIQITDCFRHEAEHAVKNSRTERDTIAIESETLTTHCILCKLGTDAVGLIPKIGRTLRKRRLDPFIPSTIIRRCRPW